MSADVDAAARLSAGHVDAALVTTRAGSTAAVLAFEVLRARLVAILQTYICVKYSWRKNIIVNFVSLIIACVMH